MPATRPFHPTLVLLALVALALLLHVPVLGLSFFSDDFSVIHRVGVQGDLGTGSFFRPLPEWTLYLNYVIAGPAPWAFRIVNVALLGVNAWLVYMLGRNLLEESTRWSTSLVAALLFLCYPFHSEPQLWIIGRGAAMATGFTLGALVIATGRASAVKKCIGVGMCGALGALCYELALLLPFLLLALMFFAPKDHRRTSWATILTASAIVVSNLFLRGMLTGHVTNEYGRGFFSHGITSYFTMAGKVFCRLLLPPNTDTHLQTILAGVLVVLLLVAPFMLIRRTRKDPRARGLLLVLSTLVAISCAIGIVGGVSTRTSESDRFLYLPSAFLCLLIALGLGILFAGRLKTVATIAFASLWLLFLFAGMSNWVSASHTIDRIIADVPRPPSGGRTVISWLPSDHGGAYIFRHGFKEALLMSRRDTTGIIAGDTLLFELDGAIRRFSLKIGDDTVPLRPTDHIVRWDDEEGFVDTW